MPRQTTHPVDEQENGSGPPAANRRRYVRVPTSMTARVSGASDVVSPAVSIVDISLGGALIAFADPAGVMINDRLVVCLQLSTGSAVLLTRVARVARGLDFRTYVGLEICQGQDDEVARLANELRSEESIVSLSYGATPR